MADQEGSVAASTVAVLGAGSTMGFAMARNIAPRRDPGPGVEPHGREGSTAGATTAPRCSARPREAAEAPGSC